MRYLRTARRGALSSCRPNGYPRRVDFVRYLVRPELWEDLPADWAELFGRDAPLGVEIGFGNGEFLAETACAHPEWNWVGFETSLTCVVKAGRKLAQVGASHVRLGLVDGRFALRELFADETVDRVCVHFPCPWPKRSHAERRVMDVGFALTLATVLRFRGRFELTTDVHSYAQGAASDLGDAGFQVSGPEELASVGPGSRYEAKWRRQGRRIWRLVAERGTKGSTLRTAEGTMPHARLGKPVTGDDIRAVVGLKDVWTGGAFVVKGAYLSSDGREGILRLFATDCGFEQQYLIAVRREDGATMVKLDGAAVPFRTPAVKRSVAAVAAALEER
ncbi:MAG: tRNA (guanine(46)-N(7))-methyltransferase [Candidatus Bipolaricaulis sibiricus]|uniref:tRNA (guanine-N(7)-)-methyltransferase n=1 Tax=Bipolaricaulis sibiricus TaxID=2501609 RepID=A0A410FTX3_BIPS1|nr:MAG: tRNA (guanine(46)-N(7))-methyltransferase [Candidatus Bipolaricaulis sibiricus]